MYHPWVSGIDHLLNTSVYVLLLSIRVALALTPILRGASMPTSARIFLILALALLGATDERVGRVSHSEAPQLIFHWVLGELVAGFSMGFGVMLVLYAVSMAGSILDVQIGFGMARVFDISETRSSPLLGAVFSLTGLLVLLLVDMHLLILHALARSLNFLPVGQDWVRWNFMEVVPHMIGVFFSLGFALAAPMVFIIFIFDLFLAILGRNLPQMNMLVFGVPMKMIVGLVFLSLWSISMGGALERIFSQLVSHWFNFFSGANSIVAWGPVGRAGALISSKVVGDGGS